MGQTPHSTESISCYKQFVLHLHVVAFRDNYVKTSKYMHTLLVEKCSSGTAVSGDIRFVLLFTRGFLKTETVVQCYNLSNH